MATAIVCLSVVIVTGYVGQLSLAQFALAGFGAWVAGRLAAAHGLPFLLVVAIAVVAAIPVGLLVAIPALRTRGVQLAVLTLGLSVMAYELVFSNGSLVGGFLGIHVPPPTAFGYSIDPTSHPGRYAVAVLLGLTGVALLTANVRRGRIGRRLVAVRGNERAAAALGIDVAGAKLFAFGLGAAMASLGGCFLAFRQGTINYAALRPVPLDRDRRVRGDRRRGLRARRVVGGAVRGRRRGLARSSTRSASATTCSTCSPVACCSCCSWRTRTGSRTHRSSSPAASRVGCAGAAPSSTTRSCSTSQPSLVRRERRRRWSSIR